MSMTSRAIATLLLLTFPVSTFAQSRLDLKSIKLATEDAVPRPIALPVLKVAPAFPQTPAVQSCVESEARGRADADPRTHKGLFWGGFAAGALTPYLLGFVVPGVTAAIKPKPASIPAGVDAACYSNGFGNKLRKERALSALWGTAAGLGTLLLITLIAYSVSDD